MKDTNVIYCYKWSFSGKLNKWDRFTNWLWFHAGERNQLWAKVLHYPLNWIQHFYHRYLCNCPGAGRYLKK